MTTVKLPLLATGLRLAGVAINTGLMYTVAAVAYPLFSRVSPQTFSVYHALHCRRMQWLVGPSFVLEGASISLCIFYSRGLLNILSAFLFILGLLITGLVAVPLHVRLEDGAHPAPLRRLRQIHLVRCLIWSLHCGLALVALVVF